MLTFTNGIVELRTGIFRKANPEEYVLSTTGWDYEKMDEYGDYTLAKELFINLFNNENVRSYFYFLEYALRAGLTKMRFSAYFCLDFFGYFFCQEKK